jgi:REP-associated tyrosine transposase
MLPKRPRLDTFDYLGRHRYFLTFCTSDRHRAFVGNRPVDLVRAQIHAASGERGFVITAYVFMPDHLHLLMKGVSDTSDLREFAGLAKQRSGFVYSRESGRRLWQPSYYDHVLRPEESSLSFVYYMFQNPVREGMVKHWADYPYLGSETMSVDEISAALEEVGADAWGE